MRRSRHATSDQYRRVTVAEIAREINRTPRQTRKLLDSLAPYGIRPRIRSNRNLPITYDAVAIDVVKALIGVPHRPVGMSWLDTYLGETNHEQQPRHPDAPRPPGP
jgi:hypothetical protein